MTYDEVFCNPDVSNVKPGDTVVQWLGGEYPARLTVTAVEGNRIVCGGWEFDRKTGMEIDPVLGWDRRKSGSYIEKFGS